MLCLWSERDQRAGLAILPSAIIAWSLSQACDNIIRLIMSYLSTSVLVIMEILNSQTSILTQHTYGLDNAIYLLCISSLIIHMP